MENLYDNLPMKHPKHSQSAMTNDSKSEEPRYGEITECELCETEQHCTDHCGIVACRRCQDKFLP